MTVTVDVERKPRSLKWLGRYKRKRRDKGENEGLGKTSLATNGERRRKRRTNEREASEVKGKLGRQVATGDVVVARPFY